MKKRIKGIVVSLLTLAALAVAVLVVCLLHNVTAAALVPTETGVWKLDGYGKPAQVWSWETENHGYVWLCRY